MLGTLMVLAAFFLLQAGRVSGTGIVYQLLNLFGAGGVLVSLLGTFNVSVFLLEAGLDADQRLRHRAFVQGAATPPPA